MDAPDFWKKLKGPFRKSESKPGKGGGKKDDDDKEDSGGSGVPAKPLKKPPVLCGAAAKELEGD